MRSSQTWSDAAFEFRWCSSIVSLALRRIKRRQGLLLFVWIDPDEVVLTSRFEERNALTH
jgi:hypothetical protein